ncbi:MAG: PH domain-containing protein [Candidatus Brocadiae bacterium]|nr:PH domain-containing protein [Candidatus Brocadiia bacterium]
MNPVDPASIYAITRPHKNLFWLYFIQSCAGLVFQPLIFLPLYFRYHTLKFRFDEEGVSASWGILFRKEVVLTYARIQDIHLSRGLVERWLGLGTVQIQTASGSSGAELSIEGTERFEEIRDFLYSRMRGNASPRAAVAAGASTPVDDEAVTLLRGIRDDLRAIRERMGKGGADV